MRPYMLGKFSPLKIPNCALWLEADRGITTVSGNVSSWADMSGNGRDVSQSTPANRPVYSSSGIGGRPTIVCNGDDALVNADLGLSSITKFSAMIVFQCDIWNDNDGGVHLHANDLNFGLLYAANSKYYASNGYVACTDTNPTIASIVYDGTKPTDAEKFKLYLNNTQQTLTFVSAIPSSLNITTLTICNYDGVVTNGLHGQISVVDLWLRAFSESERKSVEYGYSRKYDIALAA